MRNEQNKFLKRVPRKLIWRDRKTDRADRHTEEQTLFHRTLLAMSRGPRETKKSQLTIFQHCKIYLLEIGMILGGHDIADVRSL